MNDDDLGRLRAHADGELDELEGRRVEGELAVSPAMRRELDELQRLDASVAALLVVDDRASSTSGAWRALRAGRAASSPRRGLGVVVALVASIAAAILAMVFWPRPAATASGSLDASRRETIAIGQRAIAVAEAGASLSWEIDARGRAVVRQSTGAVFYRVNPGDAFDVDTPRGRVTVTGTCFTVELDPMNDMRKSLASAAAGAAIAAGVMLSVQEGTVVLANDGGTVEVAAGQRAYASSGEAPTIVDDQGSTLAVASRSAAPTRDDRFQTLVRENQAQRAELRQLHEELRRRDGQAAGGAAPEIERDAPEHRRMVARSCARTGDCDARLWTDPSPEDLAELAKCGRLLVDTPPFMAGTDVFPDGHLIEGAGLSEAEANRYAGVAEAFRGDVAAQLEGFAAELGLPEALVDRMSAAQLQGLVEAVIDVQTHDEVRRRVSAERAGEPVRPIGEQSPGERALRFMWAEGDAFEHRLATEFGVDTAREMRRASDGWGTKHTMGDFCAGE